MLKIKTECVSFSDIFLENWKPGAYDTNEFVVTGQAIYRFGWEATKRNHARIQRAVNTLEVIKGNAALDAEVDFVYAAGGYASR
jgi:hypothetical protein